MTAFPRRKFLRLTAAAAALPVLPGIGRADDYPSRPAHIITGYPAGASPDIIARIVADNLSQRLGQQFIVDDRPGAASNIGTEFAAHSAPDGYTLLIAVSTNAINSTLYSSLNFNFIHDLIAYAKANPGKVNFASQGVGTGPHAAAELFKMMTATDLVHVPYKGNYNADLLGGQIPLAFASIAQEIEFVRDGRLRCLGVTTAARSDALPDVPAIGEFVPDYEAAGWYGICTPTGTPSAIVDKLETAVIAGANDADEKSKLVAIGVVPKPMTKAEFAKFIADETDKWAKVIKFADIKVD
jgi:tripartite-type tricarboxylate transporter receptor subunit TctC